MMSSRNGTGDPTFNSLKRTKLLPSTYASNPPIENEGCSTRIFSPPDIVSSKRASELHFFAPGREPAPFARPERSPAAKYLAPAFGAFSALFDFLTSLFPRFCALAMIAPVSRCAYCPADARAHQLADAGDQVLRGNERLR
jgi:hypothetical protein